MTRIIKPTKSRKTKKLEIMLKPTRQTNTLRAPSSRRMPVITNPPFKDEQELNLNDMVGFFKTLKISNKPRARTITKPKPARRRMKTKETLQEKRLREILEIPYVR